MPIYTCPRCGFQTDQKSHFIRHISRKNVCTAIIDIISPLSVVSKYALDINVTTNEPISNLNEPMMNTNEPMMTTNEPISNLNEPISNLNEPISNLNEPISNVNEPISNSNEPISNLNEPISNLNEPVMSQSTNNNLSDDLKCQYCENMFSTIPNKRRHELHRCKLRPINTIEQNTIDQNTIEQNTIETDSNTIEPVSRKDDTPNNITNSNNNSHNTTNNVQHNNIQQSITKSITINNFGKETTNHISKKILDSLVCAPFGAIPKLTHIIHFDPNHPENDNVRITNRKDNYIDVHKDNVWLIEDRKKAIYQMMDNSYYLLDEHRAKYIENFNGFKQNNWKCFANRYEDGDVELKRRFKNKIEIDIINNGRIKKYNKKYQNK